MSMNYFLSELLFLCFRHHGSLHVAAHGRTTFIFCLLLADADLSLLFTGKLKDRGLEKLAQDYTTRT